MTDPPSRRACTPDQDQRGSAMVVSLVSMVGLIGVGGLALIATQGSLSGGAHDRFQSIALHAAEAGVASALDTLRGLHDPVAHWSELVTPSNEGVELLSNIPGNGVGPGEEGNLFSPDRQSWYEVEIHNNVGDPGFATGADDDSRVVVRSTGHGPDGARVVLEVEVSGSNLAVDPNAVCAGYGQRGLDADGAGRDDCLGVVDGAVERTYQPTAPGP